MFRQVVFELFFFIHTRLSKTEEKIFVSCTLNVHTHILFCIKFPGCTLAMDIISLANSSLNRKPFILDVWKPISFELNRKTQN